MIRHLDLFAGIGGFSLAASWTGAIVPVGFCETDPWCRRVLAKHWPEVPQHGDIRTLTGDALGRFGRIDLITGGFPCQPFSAAGQHRGKDDDRYLWPAMAAVIDEARPAFVLVENSPNIRSMVLDDMFDDLEGMGYTARAVVVPAAALGALHQRDRMWTLAHLDSAWQPQSSGSVGKQRVWFGERTEAHADPGRQRREPRECHQQTRESRTENDADKVVTDPRCERHRPPHQAVCAGRGAVVDGAWKAAPTSLEQPLRWPAEPGLLRRVHGIPHRVDRVRGLGNAIVPQVAYELLRVMVGERQSA